MPSNPNKLLLANSIIISFIASVATLAKQTASVLTCENKKIR